jgi:hypothetical protein
MGVYTLDVQVAGVSLPSFPIVSLEITPGNFNASMCSITSGLTGSRSLNSVAGAVKTFVITSKDSSDNTRAGILDLFGVQIIGPGSVFANVTTNFNYGGSPDGTYTVSYLPTIAGTYSTEISLLGGFLSESPVSTLVQPAALNADASTAVGISLSTVTAGAVNSFIVSLKDRFGNLRTGAGEANTIKVTFNTLQVSLDGTSSLGVITSPDAPVLEGAIIDNGDGTYKVSFKATLAETFILKVAVGGTNIPQSDSVLVVPSSTSELNSRVVNASLAATSQLWPVTAGVASVFTVSAQDEFGNIVNEMRSVDNFTVSAFITQQSAPVNAAVGTPVPGSAISVSYAGDGNYVVFLTAVKTGRYNVQVALNGNALSAGAYTLLVTDPASLPEACQVAALNWTATAGLFSSFNITTSDQFGNVVDNSDTFHYSLTGVLHTVSGQSQRVGFGTYMVNFNATEAGSSVLEVSLGSVSIFLGSFPQRVNVMPGQADVATSTAHGAGLVSATAGFSTSFVVRTRDFFSNNLRSGTGVVSVTLSSSSPVGTGGSAPQVVSNNDGSYTVTYTATLAGNVTFVVTVLSVEMAQPFTVPVLPAATDAAKSHLVVGGVTVSNLGAMLAGETSRFTILSRDKWNNRVLEQDTPFTAAVSGPAGPVATSFISMSYIGDGSYVGGVYAEVAGQYTLNVSIGSTGILNNPFSLTVSANVTKEEKCTVGGIALLNATAGAVETITITAFDTFGNIVNNNDVFKLTLSGGVQYTATSTNSGSGSYQVKYNATRTGEFALAITLNGKSILFGFFVVRVFPAVAEASASVVSFAPSSIVAGVPTTFVVQVNDRFGNSVEQDNGNVVAASYTGIGLETGAHETVSCASMYSNNGQYQLNFTALVVGSYNLTTTLDSVVIPVSKPLVVFPSSVNVAMSTVSVLSSTVEAGVAHGSTIQARDGFGNRLTAFPGANVFSAFVTGPNAGCSMDGSWEGALSDGNPVSLQFRGLVGTGVRESGVNYTYSLNGLTNLSKLGQSLAGASCGSLGNWSDGNSTGRVLLTLTEGYTQAVMILFTGAITLTRLPTPLTPPP